MFNGCERKKASVMVEVRIDLSLVLDELKPIEVMDKIRAHGVFADVLALRANQAWGYTYKVRAQLADLARLQRLLSAIERIPGVAVEGFAVLSHDTQEALVAPQVG
jgi:hypothetical protein